MPLEITNDISREFFPRGSNSGDYPMVVEAPEASRSPQEESELGDQLEVHFVEMPKVAEFLASRHPESFQPGSTPAWGWLSRFEKWLHILRYGKRFAAGQTLPESLTGEEGIDMAVNELQKINADREIRQLLEQREKEAHELASLQENARRAGMAQGITIGMEKGIEKGMEKGFGQAVRQLVASGMTPEEVPSRTAPSWLFGHIRPIVGLVPSRTAPSWLFGHIRPVVGLVATRLQISPTEVTKALTSPTAPSKTP